MNKLVILATVAKQMKETKLYGKMTPKIYEDDHEGSYVIICSRASKNITYRLFYLYGIVRCQALYKGRASWSTAEIMEDTNMFQYESEWITIKNILNKIRKEL